MSDRHIKEQMLGFPSRREASVEEVKDNAIMAAEKLIGYDLEDHELHYIFDKSI